MPYFLSASYPNLNQPETDPAGHGVSHVKLFPVKATVAGHKKTGPVNRSRFKVPTRQNQGGEGVTKFTPSSTDSQLSSVYRLFYGQKTTQKMFWKYFATVSRCNQLFPALAARQEQWTNVHRKPGFRLWSERPLSGFSVIPSLRKKRAVELCRASGGLVTVAAVQ